MADATELEPSSDASASAIWRSARGGAEEVEFLVPLPGPLHKKPLVDVVGQPGLAALTLVDLDILARDTVVLALPATRRLAATDVRVPTLGAYVLHKSATFQHRMPAADEPLNTGRAKDLLYLRDVLAAGAPVIPVVTDEMRRLVKTDRDGHACGARA